MSNIKITYYLVWNTKTGYMHHRHDSYESAKKKAERLANLHPCDTFAVLERIVEIKVKSFDETYFYPHRDDMPF